MSKNVVFIDYGKLINGASNLNDLDSGNTNDVKTKLDSIYDDLTTLGNAHDNCFNSINDEEVTMGINDVSSSISNLTYLMNFTVSSYLEAESNANSSYSITSTGISEAYNKLLLSTGSVSNGFDAKHYQDLLDKKINSATGTRAKVVAAAIFLATDFPRLNYFWGGGHDAIATGIDSTWGTLKTVTAEGNKHTGEDISNSLDCSGYVSWSLKNGGYNITECKSSDDLKKFGTDTSITSTDTTTIKTGDLGWRKGHIGIVVAVDGNNITFAHCAGSREGMDITTMDATTGLIVSDAVTPDAVGKKYFTDIISVNYDS
jgi:cell wall-associated NlpC family hydrolase